MCVQHHAGQKVLVEDGGSLVGTEGEAIYLVCGSWALEFRSALRRIIRLTTEIYRIETRCIACTNEPCRVYNGVRRSLCWTGYGSATRSRPGRGCRRREWRGGRSWRGRRWGACSHVRSVAPGGERRGIHSIACSFAQMSFRCLENLFFSSLAIFEMYCFH